MGRNLLVGLLCTGRGINEAGIVFPSLRSNSVDHGDSLRKLFLDM